MLGGTDVFSLLFAVILMTAAWENGQKQKTTILI